MQNSVSRTATPHWTPTARACPSDSRGFDVCVHALLPRYPSHTEVCVCEQVVRIRDDKDPKDATSLEVMRARAGSRLW